jgi:hypothetical protein
MRSWLNTDRIRLYAAGRWADRGQCLLGLGLWAVAQQAIIQFL